MGKRDALLRASERLSTQFRAAISARRGGGAVMPRMELGE